MRRVRCRPYRIPSTMGSSDRAQSSNVGRRRRLVPCGFALTLKTCVSTATGRGLSGTGVAVRREVTRAGASSSRRERCSTQSRSRVSAGSGSAINLPLMIGIGKASPTMRRPATFTAAVPAGFPLGELWVIESVCRTDFTGRGGCGGAVAHFFVRTAIRNQVPEPRVAINRAERRLTSASMRRRTAGPWTLRSQFQNDEQAPGRRNLTAQHNDDLLAVFRVGAGTVQASWFPRSGRLTGPS